MAMPQAISAAEAQKIVEIIAQEYGWISQTAREQSHREALDAIERLQIGLGAAART
jgi:alpha-D-ribose 1-methylphosphonate 5-triphosphate synthase subunit PhnL